MSASASGSVAKMSHFVLFFWREVLHACFPLVTRDIKETHRGYTCDKVNPLSCLTHAILRGNWLFNLFLSVFVCF